MIAFRMPSLGADMEAGTLVQWLKKPGDPVKRGDILAVVDTDKGAIEIEVFHDGVLDRTAVEPGTKVPVGTVLAFIRDAEEPGGAPAASVAPAPIPAHVEIPAPSIERRISPAARRAAQELGVELSSVDGTGPGGSVTRADVERTASASRTTATHPASADRTAAMRAAIAAAMSRSKREIPHLYLATTIDVTPLTTWLAIENEKRGVETRLLPIALLLKAVARAVVQVPHVNGFWIDSAFQPGKGIHIGCAVALRDGGLVAPALHDVDQKNVDTVMGELRDLIVRARVGTLRSSELTDPTITVTNLGDLGVETAYGIIYPPQVALVGLGKVVERPWIVEGRLEPRLVLTATISADHRAVDGRRAGQFLAALERSLQKPEVL
jgi:pyruvate dehydrogenase E2 component (dihydrolipoamide acetyltransferase)